MRVEHSSIYSNQFKFTFRWKKRFRVLQIFILFPVTLEEALDPVGVLDFVSEIVNLYAYSLTECDGET